MGYFGLRDTVALFSPLLQTIKQNRCATLITLFINAVMEMVKAAGETEPMPDMGLIMKHLPSPDLSSRMLMNNADMLRLWDARCLFIDGEKYFQR